MDHVSFHLFLNNMTPLKDVEITSLSCSISGIFPYSPPFPECVTHFRGHARTGAFLGNVKQSWRSIHFLLPHLDTSPPASLRGSRGECIQRESGKAEVSARWHHLERRPRQVEAQTRRSFVNDAGDDAASDSSTNTNGLRKSAATNPAL